MAFKRVFRRCRSCNAGYSSQQKGRDVILCPKCCLNCEEVKRKILAYFKNNPDQPPFKLTDAEKIAEITGTSPVLVWVLAKEGDLGNMCRRFCIHCQKELQSHDSEKDICKTCAMVIQQKLTMALNQRETGLKQQKNTEDRRSSGKYGLGRQQND